MFIHKVRIICNKLNYIKYQNSALFALSFTAYLKSNLNQIILEMMNYFLNDLSANNIVCLPYL